MRGPASYAFHSVWRLAAAPAAVYQILCHVELYPAWWPEVRSMRRLDERRFDTVCRSLMPYALRFVTEQALIDPEHGVLEAHLPGDLDGRSRWTVAADGPDTALSYDQEVVTHTRLLNAFVASGPSRLRGQPRADDASREGRSRHLHGRVRPWMHAGIADPR